MSKGGIGQNILREMNEDFHEEIPVPKIKELLNEVKTKMSKEELKERGWEFKYDILNEQKFQKGDTWKDDGQGAFLNIKDGKITITTTDKGFNQDGPNYSIKYNGKCNSMEQFDMICEMIELNI